MKKVYIVMVNKGVNGICIDDVAYIHQSAAERVADEINNDDSTFTTAYVVERELSEDE